MWHHRVGGNRTVHLVDPDRVRRGYDHIADCGGLRWCRAVRPAVVGASTAPRVTLWLVDRPPNHRTVALGAVEQPVRPTPTQVS